MGSGASAVAGGDREHSRGSAGSRGGRIERARARVDDAVAGRDGASRHGSARIGGEDGNRSGGANCSVTGYASGADETSGVGACAWRRDAPAPLTTIQTNRENA